MGMVGVVKVGVVKVGVVKVAKIWIYLVCFIR